MTPLTIDDPLRGALDGVQEPIELRDARGNLLGHFVPPERYRAMRYAAVRIPYTPEEVERRRAARGGRPLADILKDLEARPDPRHGHLLIR